MYVISADFEKKRYIVFANDDHDAVGGMHDAIGTADTPEECSKMIEATGRERGHIFDVSAFVVIEIKD